jgi:hypothetical protein
MPRRDLLPTETAHFEKRLDDLASRLSPSRPGRFPPSHRDAGTCETNSARVRPPFRLHPPQDRAFRWGGTIRLLFSTGEIPPRHASIQQRLRHFHIRNYGEVSIGLSWGIASTGERPLRESLDKADRAMFTSKRSRM